MKKYSVAAYVGVCVLVGAYINAYAQVGNLDDLNYFGTGTNRAALVIDWNDGKTNETLAWGFKWSGSLLASDMLVALASLDNRLNLRIDSNGSFGLALYGVGYQSGASPFGVSGAQDTFGNPVTPLFAGGIDDLNVTNGVTESPLDSSFAAPVNLVDHYAEAWNTPNRYWTFYLSGTSSFPTSAVASYVYPSWSVAGAGLSSVSLTDGGWYGLSFSDPGYTAVPMPAGSLVVAAVPEPSSALLVTLAFLGICHAKRRSQERI